MDILEEKKPKKGKKLLLVLTFLFFGAIIVSLLWYLASKPVKGNITVKSPMKESSFDAKDEQKRYALHSFSFLIPGIYEEKRHERAVNDPVQESVLLSFPNSSGDKLALVVESREKGDFSLSPSFQRRDMEPGTYKKSEFSEKNINGFLFSAHTMLFEETAFFVKENLIISISLTSVVSPENLRGRLLRIIGSINWKE